VLFALAGTMRLLSALLAATVSGRFLLPTVDDVAKRGEGVTV
jgi:hypothetical protein